MASEAFRSELTGVGQQIAHVGQQISASLVANVVDPIKAKIETIVKPAAPAGGAGLDAAIKTASIFQSLASIIPTVGSALSGLVGALTGPLVQMRQAAEAQTNALKNLKNAEDDYQLAVKRAAIATEQARLAAERAKASGRPQDALSARSSALGAEQANRDVILTKHNVGEAQKGVDATGGLSALAGTFGAVAGAVTAAVGAVQEFIGQIKGLVEAIAPSTIMVFNQALRDAQATIGSAFVPVFEILANTIRQVSGIILPLMEQLRPVVAQLTETFAATLIPQVRQVVAVMLALMPVVQVLATIFETVSAVIRPIIAVFTLLAQVIGFNLQILALVLTPLTEALKVVTAIMDGWAEVLRVIGVVFQALVTTVTAFLKSLLAGFNFKSIVDWVTNTFKNLIETMLVAIATFAKFIGATGFLDNLIEGLKPKTGLTAAAQNPALKSFEQIANDIALAASVAQGTTNDKAADLNDVVKRLEGIRDGTDKGNVALLSVLTEMAGYLRFLKEKAEQARDAANVVVDKGRKAATGAVAGAGFGATGAAIGAIRGLLGY